LRKKWHIVSSFHHKREKRLTTLFNFFHYKRERRLNTWLTSSTTRGREGKPLDLLLPLLEGEKASHLIYSFHY